MSPRRRALIVGVLLTLGVIAAIAAGGPANAQDPTPPASDPTDCPDGFRYDPFGDRCVEIPPTIGNPISPDPAEGISPCDPRRGAGDVLIVERPAGAPQSSLTKYGPCGYQLVHRLGIEPSEWGRQTVSMFASLALTVATWSTAAVIALLRWIWSLDLAAILEPVVTPFISTVGDQVFLPLLGAVGVLSGLYALYAARKGQATKALSVFGWAILMAIGGFALIQAPATIIGAENRFTTTARQDFLAVTAYADPTSPYFGAQGGAQQAADWRLAAFEDTMWDTFVHQPWCVMQFGDMATCETYGERLLQINTYSADELAAIEEDPSQAQVIAAAHSEAFDEMADEIQSEAPLSYPHLRGDRTGDQIGIAVLMLAGTLSNGFLHAMLGGSVVGIDVARMMLYAFGPVVFGVAAFAAMRKTAVVYLGMFIGMIGAGLLLALLLGLELLFVSTTYAVADELPGGWYASMILAIIFAVIAWKARRPMLRMFSGRRTEGAADPTKADMSQSVEDRFDRLKDRTTSVAIGYGVGGLFRRRGKGGGGSDTADGEQGALPSGEDDAATDMGDRDLDGMDDQAQELPEGATTSEDLDLAAYDSARADADLGYEPVYAMAGEGEQATDADLADLPGYDDYTLPGDGQPSGDYLGARAGDRPERDLDTGTRPATPAFDGDGPQPVEGPAPSLRERYAGQNYVPDGMAQLPAADQPGRPAPPNRPDWTAHRPPASPELMPDWPREPERVLEPAERVELDRQRAAVSRDWEQAQATWRSAQEPAADLPESTADVIDGEVIEEGDDW